jgi:hypothetical protein
MWNGSMYFLLGKKRFHVIEIHIMSQESCTNPTILELKCDGVQLCDSFWVVDAGIYVARSSSLYCFTHSGLFTHEIKLEGGGYYGNNCCVASDGTAYMMENNIIKYIV